MLALNRQEQRAILILLAALVTGGVIKYFRQHQQQQPNAEWVAERDELFATFREKAKGEERQLDSVRVQKADLIYRVNINTASAPQLQTLTKIGPALAQRIISYRAQHGTFRSIEEIQNVKGIGSKTFVKIKEHITVD